MLAKNLVARLWRIPWTTKAAAFLIALFVGTAALSVRGKSSTWDEPVHLAIGVSYLQTGDPRLSWEHPPLARLWGALPSLFMSTANVAERAPAAFRAAEMWGVAPAVVDDLEEHLLWPSRLLMLCWSVLLGTLMYAWGSRLFGPKAALLPLALLACCPPLLANAPRVATDLPVTTLILAAVFGWRLYLESPSWRTLLPTAVAVALAFATKATASILVPLFAALGLLTVWRNTSDSGASWKAELLRLARAGIVIGVSVWLGVHLVYTFHGTFLPAAEYVERTRGMAPELQAAAAELQRVWPAGWPVPLPFTYILGQLVNYAHVADGHFTYFLGEASNGGWRNFFVMLLLIKLPLCTLALMIAGGVLGVQRSSKRNLDIVFLLLPAMVMVWLASTVRIQIGIRHILPAIPFLLMLTGYVLQLTLSRLGQVATFAMVIGSCVSAWSVHPNYLMYFNFLAGGPDQGWRISIEGDDWGQGGSELRDWLIKRKHKEVFFGAFGWSGAPLLRAGITIKPVPCRDPGELVAINAGALLKTLGVEQDRCHAWMRLRKPDEKIGYSIFLYNTHVPPRPPAPSDVALFQQALRLQLTGKNTEAIPLYETYLKREAYYQAHFNLGCAYKDTGQCAAAIAQYDRTLDLWPGYWEAHTHLATCYRQLGRLEEAKKHESAVAPR